MLNHLANKQAIFYQHVFYVNLVQSGSIAIQPNSTLGILQMSLTHGLVALIKLVDFCLPSCPRRLARWRCRAGTRGRCRRRPPRP